MKICKVVLFTSSPKQEVCVRRMLNISNWLKFAMLLQSSPSSNFTHLLFLTCVTSLFSFFFVSGLKVELFSILSCCVAIILESKWPGFQLQWKCTQRNFNKTFTGLYSWSTLPTHCHTPVYVTTSNHASFLSWLTSGLVPVLKVPFLCPLEGHIHLQMQCEVGCSKVEERGFLVSSWAKWKPIRSTCTALVLITAGHCFCRPCLKM